jgi:hypothetical protein
MAIQVLRDPRRYLLAIIAVALIVVVPLMFAFVTNLDTFVTGSGIGSIVVWALLGVAAVGLMVGVAVLINRATRLEELEHETEDGGAHRAP